MIPNHPDPKATTDFFNFQLRVGHHRSFRRRPTLEDCLKEAEAQRDALQRESQEDGGAEDRRVQAARERAVRERTERVQAALDELPEVEQKMEYRKKGSSEKARASTTDADSSVPTGRVLANVPAQLYAPSRNLVDMAAGHVDTAGNNQGHENMMPFGVLHFIIALAGVFPSRN